MKNYLAPLLVIATASFALHAADLPPEGKWTSIFNGKDLDGWTPKFKGSALGVNYKDTYRVEDGMIRVMYDKWQKFEGEFGHLFYKDKFSHYRIRAEYRFRGDQVAGGPGWAFRNSGFMLHCQPPKTIRIDQEFPVSIEVQLLGGDGTHNRSTANLCTPGTHVVMGGKLITQHCTESKSKTFHGDQWVTAEVEVLGNKSFKHYVNGELVMSYEKPQLDEGDADARKLIEAAGGSVLLHEGYISLQAESHNVDFRKVEIMLLAPE